MGLNSGSHRGGSTIAKIKSQQAAARLAEYLLHPKLCLICSTPLIPRPGRRLHTVTRPTRRFCTKCKLGGRAHKPTFCLYCTRELPVRAKKYCNNYCALAHRADRILKPWQDGTLIVGQISGYITRYIRAKFDETCTRCGWCEVHTVTGHVPVEIEHIDGDWRNNCESNLTLLCPNCHSLTPTFRALNRGHGRPQRRIRQVVRSTRTAGSRTC